MYSVYSFLNFEINFIAYWLQLTNFQKPKNIGRLISHSLTRFRSAQTRPYKISNHNFQTLWLMNYLQTNYQGIKFIALIRYIECCSSIITDYLFYLLRDCSVPQLTMFHCKICVKSNHQCPHDYYLVSSTDYFYFKIVFSIDWTQVMNH